MLQLTAQVQLPQLLPPLLQLRAGQQQLGLRQHLQELQQAQKSQRKLRQHRRHSRVVKQAHLSQRNPVLQILGARVQPQLPALLPAHSNLLVVDMLQGGGQGRPAPLVGMLRTPLVILGASRGFMAHGDTQGRAHEARCAPAAEAVVRCVCSPCTTLVQ